VGESSGARKQRLRIVPLAGGSLDKLHELSQLVRAQHTERISGVGSSRDAGFSALLPRLANHRRLHALGRDSLSVFAGDLQPATSETPFSVNEPCAEASDVPDERFAVIITPGPYVWRRQMCSRFGTTEQRRSLRLRERCTSDSSRRKRPAAIARSQEEQVANARDPGRRRPCKMRRIW
jgi:hypothetical protein